MHFMCCVVESPFGDLKFYNGIKPDKILITIRKKSTSSVILHEGLSCWPHWLLVLHFFMFRELGVPSWSSGKLVKLLKLTSETVSFHRISSYFCQVSVAFSAANGSPAAKRAFKFLKTSSTWHTIVNSIQWLNKRKAVLFLLCSAN